MSSECGCGSEKLVLITACSGAANTGLLADQVARALRTAKAGSLTCLAALGAELSGLCGVGAEGGSKPGDRRLPRRLRRQNICEARHPLRAIRDDRFRGGERKDRNHRRTGRGCRRARSRKALGMWQRLVDWFVFGALASPALGPGLGARLLHLRHRKDFFLLVVVIFAISLLRSFFPPEKTKRVLEKVPVLIGNALAALLGIVTPFCSCSAVPLFIGFIEAGVPLGVTFSFLVSAPMVNEVALIMLWGLFGWKIALLYIASGIVVAIVSGIAIGKMKLEKWVEDYVYKIQSGEAEIESLTWKDRLQYAWGYVGEIVGKVWPYVLVGIAIGGFMHGYAPANFLAKYAGPGVWYAVPLAVLIGVPLYSNAAGVIPIVKVLMEKGMAMGTSLSFMMAVTALSLPEAILLRKVLKPKLLAIYFSVVAVGIMLTGYLFNAVIRDPH